MSLTDFCTLGRSGLVVSPLCLGTMTFGQGGWGADATASRSIFDAYRAAGGNFIDTADIYSRGASEALVGRFIKDGQARDEVVLATKFAFNGSASPLAATRPGGGNPNAGGAGAKNVHRTLEASLKRLGTDHIDLYWMHVWDGVTPVEEIMQTLATSCPPARSATSPSPTCRPGWRRRRRPSRPNGASPAPSRSRWNIRWSRGTSRPSISRRRGTPAWA